MGKSQFFQKNFLFFLIGPVLPGLVNSGAALYCSYATWTVETGSRRRRRKKRRAGKQTWRRLTVAERSCWWWWRLRRFQPAVPPLFSYVYLCFFFFCFCSAASLFLLLFLSMMVLLWLRTMAWRCGWQTAPVLLSTSSSFFASVFSLLLFFGLFQLPFFYALSSLVFIGKKNRGGEAYYPCPVMAQG